MSYYVSYIRVWGENWLHYNGTSLKYPRIFGSDTELGLNTLRPRQNGRRFADDTLKRIFMNENVRISIKISLKFVPNGPTNNIPALVQIMVWRRSGDKPLSEPMMVSLLTHICVTRPQRLDWIKRQISNTIPDIQWHFMVVLSALCDSIYVVRDPTQKYFFTVECRYNAIQYNVVLCTILQWLEENLIRGWTHGEQCSVFMWGFG